MEDEEHPPTAGGGDDLNRLVNEGALPAREDDGPVLVAPDAPRPWPRATTEELIAFAERQWQLHRSRG
jgi:hypothetical protein